MATNRFSTSQSRKAKEQSRPRVLDVPAYSVAEAAHYLGIPGTTLRSWVLGRRYPIADGSGFFQPVIQLPDGQPNRLSFTNLVEAHVLDAIRREHGIQLQKVRTALRYMQQQLAVPHPLASQSMATDGVDLFVERYATLSNVSREGQLAMGVILKAYGW